MRTSFLSIALFALFAASCSRQMPRLTVIETGSTASFRGMSVVDDRIAWISGSDGTIGRTTDGGRTWAVSTVYGYEQYGFRSIYAFDDRTAVIGNAGAPAYILRTEDAGSSWTVVYSNPDSAAFIDGVDFWDEENGMMYGDPIGGRMLLIGTTDGGRTWTEDPPAERPLLDAGEYSFAASGTGIRCYGDQKLVISTGGVRARLWMSEDKGRTWNALATPMIQGEPTTGIFSFAFITSAYVIIVGGDYQRDTLAVDHVFTSPDGGADWMKPTSPTRGYRECVEVIEGNTVVAVGPSGMDISFDGGEHWSALSNEPRFHVVRKARSGSLALVAGDAGKAAILE